MPGSISNPAKSPPASVNDSSRSADRGEVEQLAGVGRIGVLEHEQMGLVRCLCVDERADHIVAVLQSDGLLRDPAPGSYRPRREPCPEHSSDVRVQSTAGSSVTVKAAPGETSVKAWVLALFFSTKGSDGVRPVEVKVNAVSSGSPLGSIAFFTMRSRGSCWLTYVHTALSVGANSTSTMPVAVSPRWVRRCRRSSRTRPTSAPNRSHLWAVSEARPRSLCRYRRQRSGRRRSSSSPEARTKSSEPGWPGVSRPFPRR